MTWMDITIYSRDDKGRIPRWWRWKGTDLKVGNHHTHYAGNPHWHVSFMGQRVVLCPVDEMTEAEAKAAALRRAIGLTKMLLDALTTSQGP